MANDLIKTYMEELDKADALSEEECKLLFQKALSGDDEAKAKLIEGTLYIVPLRVSEFLDSKVNVSDMIQEGNMALIEAVEALFSDDDRDIPNFTEYFSELIDISLAAFVSEESKAQMAANNIKNQANRLLDITTEFEKEHDRPATLEELSKLSGLSEEDVENIVKTSYNAMELAKETENN